MLFESLGLAVMNFLRIPPGTSVRKSSDGSSQNGDSYELSELVKTIIDITRDDVCYGGNPVFVINDKIEGDLKVKVDSIAKEFNTIIRWAAWDVLTVGHSEYVTKKTPEGKLVFVPVVGKVEYFMDYYKNIVLVIDGEEVPTSDYLIFLNYEKESLEQYEDKKYMFKIKPIGIQMKNAYVAMKSVETVENSILAYRRQLSKIVRIANVDIGAYQGDQKDTVIDSISSALNANSSSLNYNSMNNDFDDSIPVVPNRKGLGRPDIYESVPAADISNLADLDHAMNKLFLVMRFPKSYADFSTALSSGSIVSTIRGDIRYNRMIEYTRDCLINAMNKFLKQTPLLEGFDDIVSMAMLPTSEDDDILTSLEGVSTYTSAFFEKVLGQETKEGCICMLESLKVMMKGTSSFDYITEFFNKVRELIEIKFPDETGEVEEGGERTESLGGGRIEGPDFGGEDDFGGPDFGDEVDMGGGTEETTEVFEPSI